MNCSGSGACHTGVDGEEGYRPDGRGGDHRLRERKDGQMNGCQRKEQNPESREGHVMHVAIKQKITW